MKKTRIIYLVLTVFLAFACKKIIEPLDEGEANNPIYLLEGLMDGDSLNLYVNDTTVFLSSLPSNINGIPGYSSSISDAVNGFEIKMTLIRPEILLDAYGAKAIENGDFKFLNHQPTCKRILFSNESNQGDYVQMDLNGVYTSGLEMQFKEYGVYNALVRFPNLNDNVYNIPVSTGFDNLELNASFSVEASGNHLILNSSNQSHSHEWVLNDSLIGQGINFNYQCANGLHELEHKVIDGFGNEVVDKTMLFISNGNVIWVMSSEYCKQEMAASNFGKIIIEVKKDNEIYSSAFVAGNQFNNVKLSEVIYSHNYNTNKVEYIKFRIDFDADLKTVDGSKMLNLNNMKGVFNIRIE